MHLWIIVFFCYLFQNLFWSCGHSVVHLYPYHAFCIFIDQGQLSPFIPIHLLHFQSSPVFHSYSISNPVDLARLLPTSYGCSSTSIAASVFVLFFLTLLVAVVRNASAGEPYYEYLQFVLQNPRTLDPNSAVNDRFTIHVPTLNIVIQAWVILDQEMRLIVFLFFFVY